MVISSLIVEAIPARAQTVMQRLGETSGVEVHGIQDNQIIITIEAETVDTSHEIASSLIGIEGAHNINLIYANFEDDPSFRN